VTIVAKSVSFMRRNRSNRSLPLADIDPSVALVQARRTEEKHRATFWEEREIDIARTETSSMDTGKAKAGI
jgi:hypothetical protein